MIFQQSAPPPTLFWESLAKSSRLQPVSMQASTPGSWSRSRCCWNIGFHFWKGQLRGKDTNCCPGWRRLERMKVLLRGPGEAARKDRGTSCIGQPLPLPAELVCGLCLSCSCWSSTSHAAVWRSPWEVVSSQHGRHGSGASRFSDGEIMNTFHMSEAELDSVFPTSF